MHWGCGVCSALGKKVTELNNRAKIPEFKIMEPDPLCTVAEMINSKGLSYEVTLFWLRLIYYHWILT